MQTTEFNDIVVDLNNNQLPTTEQINGMVDSYSYFQVAKLLRLLELKRADEDKYNEALKQFAFLLPDRRHLLSVVNKFSANTADSEMIQQPVENSTVEPNPEETTETFMLLDDVVKTDPEIISTGMNKWADDDILEIISEPTGAEIEINSETLIDKFLNNIPSIRRDIQPPLPGEEFENEDISVHSVLEPEELATESLAEIYVQQRYFNKAIEVYRKLSLKYPEKSSYFAVQIERINQELNH